MALKASLLSRAFDLLLNNMDDMDDGQLQTRAIRMFLDDAGRSDLKAVPVSFEKIANVRSINYFDYFGDCNLKVLPECINLLTGLRELSLG